MPKTSKQGNISTSSKETNLHQIETEPRNNTINCLLRNHEDCRRKLQRERNYIQQSLLALTTHLARIQLHLRQILQSPSWERDRLLKELEKVAFKSANAQSNDDLLQIYHDFNSIDRTRKLQSKLIERLHDQVEFLMNDINGRHYGKRYSTPVKRE